MRTVYERELANATEIQRQLCRETTKLSGRKFGAVAKVLWPFKTSAHVAALAGVNQRTAERWIAGEFEAPAVVLAAIIVEITKPQ